MPHPLIPNSPTNRLKHVINQLDGTPSEVVLPDVVDASLSLIGRDGDVRTSRAKLAMLFEKWRPGTRIDGGRHVWAPMSERHRVKLYAFLGDSPPGRYDALIPWMAREMARLYKAVREAELVPLLQDIEDGKTGQRGRMRVPSHLLSLAVHRKLVAHDRRQFLVLTEKGRRMLQHAAPDDISREDYDAAVEELDARGTAIGMWVERTGADLSKLTLAEALEGAATLEEEVSGAKVPQGTVVYTFSDGYTVQRLAASDLEAEGEVMQHCVGEYCRRVESGASVIFSIRSPAGLPRATIEWKPDEASSYLDPDELLASIGFEDGDAILRSAFDDDNRDRQYGSVTQIFGKQNQPPIPKYMQYVREFIESRLGGDLMGLMLTKVPGEHLTIKNARAVKEDLESMCSGIEDVTFVDAELRDCWFPWLTRVSFIRGTLNQCQFHQRLSECEFEETRLADCELHYVGLDALGTISVEPTATAVNMRECLLDGVEIEHQHFAACRFLQCQFTGTSDLRRCVFQDCDLTGTTFTGTTFSNVRWVDSNLSGAAFERLESVTGVSMKRVNLEGATADEESADMMMDGMVVSETVVPWDPHGLVDDDPWE